MGRTEVTNAEYVEFLNAVAASDPFELYDTQVGSSTLGGIVRTGSDGSFRYAVKPPALDGEYSYENKPVVFVSWFSAARFANWLHNGQGGQGTTEDGAYTLLGGTPTPSNAKDIRRNADARWWLPQPGEWAMAAYFDRHLDFDYDYPTDSNVVPDNNPPSLDTGNSANFYDDGYTTGNPSFPLTDAGAYKHSRSPYHTLDQGGNVSEWVELFVPEPGPPICLPIVGCIPGPLVHKSRPGFTGGSWDTDSGHLENFTVTAIGDPSGAYSRGDLGFRIASHRQGRGGPGLRIASIPEPAGITLCLSGVLMLLWRRTM
jgi:formylglycine-generating enzyme required for sulfatase activity